MQRGVLWRGLILWLVTKNFLRRGILSSEQGIPCFYSSLLVTLGGFSQFHSVLLHLLRSLGEVE